MDDAISIVIPIETPNFLKLLAHDLRWKLITALVHSDRCGLELAGLLDESQNLISYHLKRLREGALVHERRSSADARDIYYSVDLEKLRTLYFSAGKSLHPALGDAPDDEAEGARDAPGDERSPGGPPTRVLFLCTHNSARSQMAEAIMRNLGGDAVEVYSAGTQPSRVHPNALRALTEMGIDGSDLRSKHLNDYCDQDFDYIITVCDRARESCPLFPGDPEQMHWSFPDPSAVEDEEEQYQAFIRTFQELTTRVRYLLALIENERRYGRGGEAG